jgi:hypothetical protein
MAFGLRPPKDIADLCGVWLNQVDQRIRSQICVGISAFFWFIWLCRNDVTFDGKKLYSYLQVIFRATYWTRFWSTMQKNRNKQLLKWVCRTLETVAMEIFAKHGWSSFKRIDA